MLISILDSDLHDDVQSSGNDIAFANDTAWLDHDLELFEQDYNSTHAKLVAWVRIPSLSTSLDTTIYLYYENASMSPRENPEGVWNNNYEGIWHLSEDPSDPSPQFEDKTSNNNDGTAEVSMTSGDQISGQIDGSIDFDGSNDYISMGSSINIASSSFSVSTWAKRGSSTSADIIFQQGSDSPNDGLHIGFRDPAWGNKFTFAFWADDLDTPQSYTDTDWHHWVCTYDASTKARKIYRDGINIASDTASNHFLGSGQFLLGYDEWVSEAFDGQLDESRLLNIALSSEWVNTSYNNQNDPKSFYSIGKERSVLDPPNAHYFMYYKEIIIDHSMVCGLNDLVNFPVLISILDTDLHDDVQSTGNDIAFANATTWLDHEIELFEQDYSSTHAKLVAWVRIPRLTSSLDTIIRMYYGNISMSSRENPSSVWNPSYKGVWHLKEDPSAPAPQFSDSTTYNNDGTAVNLFSSNQTTGKIDGGLIFNDENEACVNVSDDNSLDLNSDMTISAWVKTNDNEPDVDIVITKWSLTPPNQNYWLGKLNSNIFAFYVDATQRVVMSLNLVNDNNWHYIVGVADSTNSLLRIYLDGVQINTTTYTGSSQTGSHYLNIGRSSGIIEQEWNGKIDEVRVSNKVRSADWLNTEFNNQNDTNNFYTILKEYSVSGNPPNEDFFDHYKEITISHSMVSGSHDLLNFPVLISISDTDLQDDVQQSNGNDIAFAYKGAWLDHEIESFDQAGNGTHAQLISWVCIPRLSTSRDTVIRMYYGNSTMGSRENPEGVWDPNYKGIWHLSEDPTGTIYDSTSNDKDGTSSGSMTSNDQITGKINGAIDFDGLDDTISFGSWNPSTDFNPSSGTISFWINRQFLDSVSENKMVLQIRASGTDRIMFRYDEGGFEWRFHHEGNDIQSVNYAPAGEIPRLEWVYVVQTWDVNLDFLRAYINGSLFGSNSGLYDPVDNSYTIYLASDKNGGEYFYGNIDEVRFSDIYRTDEWIETEYNNQNDPQSFFTLGSEESFDNTPPTYSNLIESSDPLELGNTEIITINVSDPSGINQVKIEYASSNHSMINIRRDMWQYNWTPGSVGSYPYTIWMEDNCNNWNSTIGSIEVVDTTPPTYSDLIESADILQLGQNETISIKVYDSPGSGVNQVLLEYGPVLTNHSMVQAGNTWTWSKWKPALGPHSYTIWMEDNSNNWNYTSGTITVVETYAPIIENLSKYDDPLELGNNITIMVDVFDEETNVSTVLIELGNVNYTMKHIGGNAYGFNWTRSWVGTVLFVIYANDSLDNWNSYSSSFDIIDTTKPVIKNLTKSEEPLELGNTIIISVNCSDLSDIKLVKIEYLNSNYTMTNVTGEIWEYDAWTPDATGNWSYTIWVEDNNNNWAFVNDSILVQDTILPIYSDLTEEDNPVELGDQLIISINATDLAGIKDVLIEFENSSYRMRKIDVDIWQYNSWVPNSIGNYTYTIYLTDNNDNLNYVESWILFQDTKVPTYSNFFESSDPLELGDNPIISIDIYDFAGINQSLIEFEGTNHSMTNIYGNTWQINSWTPDNWIVYQYKIYMQDKSGNWIFVIGNLTVQDTIPPPLPRLVSNPSGDVSGNLVFDWSDGIDPSGILYYILIIDNETDPSITPGYVYYINITNLGSESSYHELQKILPLGKYYYFLSQIDGVGQESDHTMGSFTVISMENGSSGNNILIIIAIAVVSAVGSVTAIFIVRKKLKKEITPSREKISLKTISSHIDKLSRIKFTSKSSETQRLISADEQDKILTSKESTDEKDLKNRIDEIKVFGEELFAEGAYLEALKQFTQGRDLLINLERKEEANLFTDLISGIEGLIEEREKRLDLLEQIKIEGNAIERFELYYEIIFISKKLRDPDSASFYHSELISYFQNSLNTLDLENYRYEINLKAESLIKNNLFEIAAQLYKKCEFISQLFIQLGREEETINFEEFRNKKEECLKNLK